MIMLPAPLADLERAYLSISEEVSSGVLSEEFAASLLREATARDADGHLWCVDFMRCGSTTEFAVIDETSGQLVPASPSAFSLKPGQAPGPVVAPEIQDTPTFAPQEETVFSAYHETDYSVPVEDQGQADIRDRVPYSGRRLHPALVFAALIAAIVGLVALFGSDGTVEEAPAFEPAVVTTTPPETTVPPAPEAPTPTTEAPFEPEMFNGLPGAEELPSF